MTIMTIYLINRYAKWKERSKLSQQEDRDNDQEDEAEAGPRGQKRPGTALPAAARPGAPAARSRTDDGDASLPSKVARR